VGFTAITLYVASQRVFNFVGVYSIIDSVRTLLDKPSYVLNTNFEYAYLTASGTLATT
jgi:hypothetical protein